MKACTYCGKSIPVDSIIVHENVCSAFQTFEEALRGLLQAVSQGINDMGHFITKFAEEIHNKDKENSS